MFALFMRGVREPDTLMSPRFGLLVPMGALQSADVTPTSAQMVAVAVRQRAFAELMKPWAELKAKDLAILNEEATKANLLIMSVESALWREDKWFAEPKRCTYFDQELVKLQIRVGSPRMMS